MTPGRRKLAASNIAWDPSEDDAVAAVLHAVGFTGVEIAPSKRWESPIEATKREIADYRAAWEKRGLPIVALQSLLFGRPDLQLFGNAVGRRALSEFLTSCIEMAAGLGTRALVFGSPKNRQRKSMPIAEATDVAAEFFREIGAVAMSRRCIVCIEPNPPAYGCDFINTMDEAVELCRKIGSRGIGVQGDMGAVLSMQLDAAAMVKSAGPLLRHFHVSEPALAEIATIGANEAASAALEESRYDGWVSIEMRPAVQGSHVEAVRRAAELVRRVYGRTEAIAT